jgi:hypothetical protein
MTTTPPILYLPYDWCDEYQPIMQESPSQFILVDGETTWLNPLDHKGEHQSLEDDDDYYREKLELGSVIQFYRMRNYGTITVTRKDDGAYSHAPVPEGPNSFWSDDVELYGNSLEELLAQHDLPPESFDVRMFEELPSQLFILEMVDGKPAFVACAVQ